MKYFITVFESFKPINVFYLDIYLKQTAYSNSLKIHQVGILKNADLTQRTKTQ